MNELTLKDAALILSLAVVGVAVAWAAFLYGSGGRNPLRRFDNFAPGCPECGLTHKEDTTHADHQVRR